MHRLMLNMPPRFQHEEIDAVVAPVKIAHRVFERVFVHLLQDIGTEIPPCGTHIAGPAKEAFTERLSLPDTSVIQTPWPALEARCWAALGLNCRWIFASALRRSAPAKSVVHRFSFVICSLRIDIS